MQLYPTTSHQLKLMHGSRLARSVQEAKADPTWTCSGARAVTCVKELQDSQGRQLDRQKLFPPWGRT